MHASIRYKVLDRCLQKQSEDNTERNLRDLCCDAIAEFDSKYESAEISLRTFRNDIAYIKNCAKKHDATVVSKLGRNGYYYYYDKAGFSIYKNELSDTEIGQLKCVMQLLARFKGLPEYDSIAEIGSTLEKKYGIESGGQTYVEYEHVESTGEEIMSDVCNFIIKQQPISITYMPYGKPDKKWTIHPYLLKEFNNRWFLFGYNETEGKISNIPLDRIRADYEPVANSYIPNTFRDFSTYFDNVVGVTVNDAPPEKILFKASKQRAPYIESKPLHQPQIIEDANNCIFSINVIPNRELDALIMSYGGDIEILEPKWYRSHIKQLVTDSYKLYSSGQEDCTSDTHLCTVKASNL